MTRIGPENLTQAGNTTETGIGINKTVQTVGNFIGPEAAGTPQYLGPLLIAAFAYGLWRARAGIDVSAAVILPTTFMLAYYGYLPFGDGIIFSLLVTTAGLFAFGVSKYVMR